MAKKMQAGKFDLDDLADQLRQMSKMGGMGGLMSVTGEEAQPMKAGVALCDVLTGMYATVAMLGPCAMPSGPARGSTSTWPCSTSRWRRWPTRRSTT